MIALLRRLPFRNAAAGARRHQQQAHPHRGSHPAASHYRTHVSHGVDLVTVDVAVVNSRGNPVEDLRAPDFEVKIDGQVRRVVSAALVKVAVEAARRQTADKTETYYTSNLTPDQGRHIVIAVDQINISHGALQPIMAAAQRFLDRLSPLDKVAFIAYPEPGPRVNFTSDKLTAADAMQALYRPGRCTPQSEHRVTEALAIYNRALRSCGEVAPRVRA